MSARWTTRAIAALRESLAPVEAHAATLSWAKTTPWTTRARITTERRLWIRREKDQRIVRLDLHGLDADGARLACTLLRDALLTPTERRVAWTKTLVCLNRTRKHFFF